MEDFSIKDEFDKCTSELRVKIQGSAIAADVTTARTECRVNCRAGVDQFKGIECPKLCGLSPITVSVNGPTTCRLCDPNKNDWIQNCRDLIDIGANNCANDCDNAAPDSVGTANFRVSGSSGAIKRRFPSNLYP